ncbi:Cysteine/serine-rich nuclear protein N-terminal domain-containing protein [Caenorhabditis elegans]|uniref:Cysteine/serine-rich nuclear protein N-terminal domain-containing protein n=1 Tax=Caenorhabditis elegans TaxID=6239 RepID=A0A078BPM2_CAEEL|nr:Cysteine/serine-rich nuclear protein N-terminal domain-containing protein [Caenorhabditis elegans]CDX47490.1 Cysteine/serine-rich nuclear protein N-terminal domain-containing protein [Caenorhabditis elegans]|eukprot:NP_001293389.1 Uncharacterized protein CELE_C41D11.3 [Caenorhabditis elegans]
MQSSASNDPNKPTNNEIIKTPLVPPSPRGGLKRMAGMSQLKSTFSISLERTIPPPSSSSSFLSHSTSMVSVAASLKRAGVPSLTRTKTSALPIKMEKKPMVPLRIEQDHQTPIRKLAPESIPSLEDQVTPPMRRSSSGSMLLRQTPERIRRQEEDVETPGSPVKRYRRSGSMPRLEAQSLDVPIRMEIGNSLTPVLKRKRTSSLTCLFSSDMPPILTPQRLRPRGISETRTIDDDVFVPKSPTKKPITSPIKKRVRQDSENRSTSPLKKRYISSFSIRLEEEKEIEKAVPTPTMSTPMRKFKSTIFNPRAVTERIAQTYGTGSRQLLKSTSSTVLPAPPALVARSTSGETYYSATEGEDSILSAPPPQSTEVISIPKQDDLQRDDGKMVPLVKKQMSIDEKIMEDDEDEGFGDSMKTIKRGQGSSLARSLSLKLSPKTDQQKPIGADTEKSCSTPSLPTAPLLSRQGSTSSLRFKVSPSTFLKPIATPIIDVSPTPRPDPEPLRIIVAAAAAAPVESTELSEPSTSKTPEQKAEPAMQKSALRKHAANFSVREEIFIPGIRRKKIRFSGLHVHYFDRRQGGSTVPTEGDISLDMHNKHHSHRYFSLSTGKRPILDLLLYADDDLSDGEVIDPDSDEDRDYDEYASAKSIPRINQRHRIKLLKKSGVKVEKNTDAIDSLRNTRVECGCSCENGVCLPETCQCAIDGIHCQVDGGEWPTQPCACFAETCTNPEGRTFYDPEAVHEFRQRTIMNWRASQKTGISGSPVVKKFADSDEEDDKAKTWLLKNAIPIKLEESPTKYPVTPVYTRRSRSSLSDIRESTSETTGSITPSTSLSERIKAMQHLDNEVCVEQEEKDEDDAYFMDNKEDTIIEADLTLQEVYVEQDMVAVTVESSSETTDIDANEMIEATAMSPVKTTLVV